MDNNGRALSTLRTEIYAYSPDWPSKEKERARREGEDEVSRKFFSLVVSLALAILFSAFCPSLLL